MGLADDRGTAPSACRLEVPIAVIAPAMYYDRPITNVADKVSILDGSRGPELDIVDGEGEARAIVWPGMGAETRSLQRIWLKAASRTVELRHPGEAAYYVVA